MKLSRERSGSNKTFEVSQTKPYTLPEFLIYQKKKDQHASSTNHTEYDTTCPDRR